MAKLMYCTDRRAHVELAIVRDHWEAWLELHGGCPTHALRALRILMETSLRSRLVADRTQELHREFGVQPLSQPTGDSEQPNRG